MRREETPLPEQRQRLLGLRMSTAQEYLQRRGTRYRVEMTEPTRKLGVPGEIRVINTCLENDGTLVLTGARRFI